MNDSGVNAVTPGGNGEEETSPDLLRNTPSNIARLEDVIEHSKGRHKYLAQTRSPSDGSDVRWYFCKVPLAENELAASVPRAEIVGKSDYLRFGMRDSLAIEASFLQREEELLSRWWREYAECSEGPRPRVSSGKKSDAQLEGSSELYEVEEERVGVPVKGGLYEVDLVKRHCFPVYWNGENRRVLRGHWFACKGVDWLPLREDVAEQLEIAYRSQVWHRRTFQPSGLFAARVDLQGSTPGLHTLFTGEDDTWEAWLNIDASGITVISFNGNGTKLRRGYAASRSPKPSQDELRQRKEEEMDDYCSQVPVRHLVFMVHGIGQRLAKSNLVDDVGNFRHITASLSEQHLSPCQLNTQRVLFIPCQWRKGLKLSGEAAVEKCTLDGVRGLRVMLGATVHDVLYYMSPVYCQEIIDSVSNQLNWLYLKFLKRNPGYDGKVSIYGHSLGSVLSYDILCHQKNLYSPFAMDWMFKSHAPDKESSNLSNDQHLASDALADLGNNNTGAAKDRMDHIDRSSIDGQPPAFPFQNEQLQEVNPVTSNILQIDKMASHPVPKINKEDVCQRVVEPVHTKEEYRLEDTTETFCDEASSSAEQMNEESKDVCNMDTELKLLTDEIDSLKAKIVELELKCKSGDMKNKVTTVTKQPIPQKLVDGQPACVDDIPKSYTPYIRYTKLEFKVDTFFAVGSPLGVFLALRNIRIGIGRGKDYWSEENISEEVPACRQMFNIFHPFDPVAYRVEPFVCKEYVDKRPVIIPYHKGGKRLHIGFQEFTEDLAARSQAVMDQLCSVRARVLTVCTSRDLDNMEGAKDNSEENHEKSYGALMMERLTGSSEGRIDHVLQDKTFEHPYLQAIGAHTNYWRDHDTALFILKHLYHEIPEDPSSSEEYAICSSKVESCSASMPDQREEELPLTFSDKSMVRSFSRKAMKFIKKPLKN